MNKMYAIVIGYTCTIMIWIILVPSTQQVYMNRFFEQFGRLVGYLWLLQVVVGCCSKVFNAICLHFMSLMIVETIVVVSHQFIMSPLFSSFNTCHNNVSKAPPKKISFVWSTWIHPTIAFLTKYFETLSSLQCAFS
jgi:hypothetical protein